MDKNTKIKVEKSTQLLAAVMVFLLFALVGCSHTRSTYRSLSAEEFAECIATEGIEVVDVRTPMEYARGHLAGAININVKENNFCEECARRLKKRRGVGVYCQRGKRSKMAAELLNDMGYDVVELDSGIEVWQEKLEYGQDIQK